jgi:hypothetical protein
MEERLRQTVVILKKITEDLGIPYSSPEVQELKGRMNDFVRTGEPWEGQVMFAPWGRVACCMFTRKGHMEVTLEVIRQNKSQKRV